MDFFPLYQSIVSSRSYYEEGDYEENTQDTIEIPDELKTPILCWIPEVSKNLKNGILEDVSSIIFGFQKAGATYVTARFSPNQLIGTYILPEINLAGNCLNLANPSNKLCNIYRLSEDPSIIIVSCSYTVSQESAYIWSRKLLSQIKAKRVIIYDTLDGTDIKADVSSEGLPHPPYLRKLQTSNSSKMDTVKILETPNYVKGCSASVMSWCEIYKVPAVLYLSLNDIYYGNSETTVETIAAFDEPFNSLLKNKVISSGEKFNIEQLTKLFKEKIALKTAPMSRTLLYA